MSHFLSDTALISALHDKDAKAFDQIFNEYFRQLSYFADSIINNKEEAEDIAANTFVKLLQANPVFESKEKIKSWLFTIARNASLDALRANKRHHQAHNQIKYLGDPANPAGTSGPLRAEQNIELDLIRSEALATIYGEIQNLPGQCREVIRRSFIDGKSVAEIAAEMKLAYQTVQNQKQRGIKLLRLALAGNDLSPLLLLACLLVLKKNGTELIFF